MDFGMLLPDIAKALHIAPSMLVFIILCVNVGARVTARKIPNDATGFWGFVRQAAAILGAEVPSSLTKGVTVTDVAAAALKTPPIPQKVEAEKAESSGDVKT